EVVSAGDVKIGDLRLDVNPTGELTSVDAIGNVVVSTGENGDLVYLRDIATVRRAFTDPQDFYARYNGKPAITIGISNVTGANVAKIGDDIRDKIEETIGERPLGVSVDQFYHQGDAVNEAVESFASNVIAALVIVLIVLLVFMGPRSAIIIGLSLLITIAATVATMSFVGIPMHRISLGALIIALGMLVDNAIVVTEGILVGVQAGRKIIDVASEIVKKTIWALLGGTLVGIIAFAPIGLAPGDTGEYAGSLFWVIMISLFYSWLFAITLVPFLSDLIFPSKAASGATGDGAFMRIYKNFLRGVIYMRWVTLVLAFGVFSAAVYGFTFVQSGFFPASSTPQIAIDYWLPEGSDISATERDIKSIEQFVLEQDGITKVHSAIGAGAQRYMLIYSPETSNTAYGSVLMRVDDLNKIPDLISRIQAHVDESFPNAQARVWRYTLGPSQGLKIQAVFAGPDPEVLRNLASKAEAILIRDPESTGVTTDWRQEVPVVVPDYDAERGRRVGVSRSDLADALLTNTTGQTIGTYREGDDLIPIVSRAPLREREDFSTGAGIQIVSGRTGDTVPLSETVRGYKYDWRNGQLRRVDRVWTIKVKGDPQPDVLASTLFNRVRPQIEAIERPEGYDLYWDGEFGDSAEANSELAGTIPLGVLAMFMVVVFLFNAIRQPLVIWTIVPFSIVGVVFGLVLTDTALEFMAILGLLSLSGLLIKNAIVLVDEIDTQIADGKPRFDAVVDSAASRVRPIMMGAMTTVLGVLPLMGDIFFRSMAVVIVFGLSFATVLTLVLLPAVYAIFFRIKASETADRQTEPV
ncbi:MAG: efflux RND transporter permease subunit, partial [Pseudomonadota bacterium]